jgi:adenylosuccinate synthase
LDVAEVVLVLRAHPIRVAGNSGPLLGETTWAAVAKQAGLPEGYQELTTATRKVRRVGTFNPEIVKRAIAANNPTMIVLNHFDYVDPAVREGRASVPALNFLRRVEEDIERNVDLVGTGPGTLVRPSEIGGGKNQPTSKYARHSD